MAKYSIILPVRNGGEHVKACIHSILAQTCQDFDLIVLENGSTDGTPEWIASLNNPNITIYPATKSLSIEENWHRVVTIRKNEFITIIGHDDILYPNYLEVMNDLMKARPDAALYQTHFDFIDNDGALIRPGKPNSEIIDVKDYFHGVLTNSIEITGTGFMFRADAYDANGGIPDYPNLLFADIEIWMRMIQESYMAIAGTTCFAFRFHLENTSKSTGHFRLQAFERLIQFFIEFTGKNPALKQVLEADGPGFFQNYVVGACHKLIYIHPKNRNGVTIDDIILSAQRAADSILPQINFNPNSLNSVRLAKMIDKQPILRRLFLFYKSFFKRTF